MSNVDIDEKKKIVAAMHLHPKICSQIWALNKI